MASIYPLGGPLYIYNVCISFNSDLLVVKNFDVCVKKKSKSKNATFFVVSLYVHVRPKEVQLPQTG